MILKHCRKAKKRKYNSRAAALRGGLQKYGTSSNAYLCQHCDTYHLTRRDVPQCDEDPQLEQLIHALLGKKAS